MIENLKAFSSRVTLFFFREIYAVYASHVIFSICGEMQSIVARHQTETRVVGKTPSFTSRTYVVDVRRPSRGASRVLVVENVYAAELERSLKVTDAFPKVDTKSDNSISSGRSTTSPRTELDCRF